ncbi:LLM class oxidoreductase [Granulicoccus phenolivorans]|uniref:LLM class oxidoreductase n=1 Tax=Granulicoccus phenolivorans TaxID=266854 RepID=UPI00047DE859|nr:LLM class oxidoreductase [Granulicoccus phenolivorans]
MDSSSDPLTAHPGMRHAFRPGAMTIGVITPLEGFTGAIPTMNRHAELIDRAEAAGFSTVWVRDVPLLDPSFGDTGQIFDTWTYLGYLAARTNRIALGTASIVLPLRHPIHTAKAAASIDQLSGGRFLLGAAAGDRPVEFPAFGIAHATRSERFRESLQFVRRLTEESFPKIDSFLGHLNGTADLIPRPVRGRLPIFMTGRGGQDLDWIAAHTDGWQFYLLPFEQQQLNIQRWRRLTGRDDGGFKPFAQSMYIDLTEDPTAAPQPLHQGLRLGREPLLEFLQAWQAIGVDQLMINFKQSRRPVAEVIEEFAEYLLPHFPPGPGGDEGR